MEEKKVNNLDKYNKIFIETFLINNEALNSELVYNSIPTWDSIGHMSMIAQLEESFDIMMDTEDIIDFSSYNKGKEILKKYNIEI